jgi:hypothetical protein
MQGRSGMAPFHYACRLSTTLDNLRAVLNKSQDITIERKDKMKEDCQESTAPCGPTAATHQMSSISCFKYVKNNNMIQNKKMVMMTTSTKRNNNNSLLCQ